MCESVIGSGGAMQGLQTDPCQPESVAPSSMTLDQKGGGLVGQEGFTEGPGCDGYLQVRVTGSVQAGVYDGENTERPLPALLSVLMGNPSFSGGTRFLLVAPKTFSLHLPHLPSS